MLVPLTQGAYTAQSIIASAQRCVNLYAETNPPDSPAPTTHYLTPGLVSELPGAGQPTRGIYTASNGSMFEVFGDLTGSSLYVSVPSTTSPGISSTTLVASFNSTGTTPVSMADNGLVLIIVDGSNTGWVVDLANGNIFAQITDLNFLGSARVDFLDTFFLFNVVGTNKWYISLSEANFNMLAGVVGSIQMGTIAAAGNSSVTNGTYNNAALTGGTGTTATANIIASSSNVTKVTIVNQGSGYVVGDQLSATLPGTGILTFTFTAGTGYTNGNYNNIALGGGAGTGATANIVVTGGVVSSATIASSGAGYAVANALTAAIPGGSGFTATVATVGGAGFVYVVDTVGGTAFDPLDIATKSTFPDPIVTFIVMHAEIWLIGSQTTEVWYNAGAADFVFQILPGVFIEHGCAAPYSVAKQDLSIYWLSRDRQGQAIVLKGNGYAAHRISTFAIENEISSYSKITDAIGWTYQQLGHTFYVLTFPTADKTWVFDESTALWHERASLQQALNGEFAQDGFLHKAIYNSCGVCGGLVYVGDYLGNIWQLDPTEYTENGVAISRIRSWPHLLNSQKRVSYSQFIADMECGTDNSVTSGDGTTSDLPPMISLRWSDDRGKTYGNYVQQSLGAVGQYLTNASWNRLGMARDRVFELSWSVPTKTALNGAWVDFKSSAT